MDEVPLKARPTSVHNFSGPAEQFKREIEKAVREGASPNDLVLRLTLRDGAKLKRDRGVQPGEIGFANGEMRYLGVKVVEGDTASSALVRLQA